MKGSAWPGTTSSLLFIKSQFKQRRACHWRINRGATSGQPEATKTTYDQSAACLKPKPEAILAQPNKAMARHNGEDKLDVMDEPQVKPPEIAEREPTKRPRYAIKGFYRTFLFAVSNPRHGHRDGKSPPSHSSSLYFG